MCSWRNTSTLLLLVFCQYVYGITGDPVMYFPPFEVRTVKSDRPYAVPSNQYFQPEQNVMLPSMSQHSSTQQLAIPERSMIHQQPAMSIDAPPKPVPKPKVENERNIDSMNFTFAEVLNALTNAEEKKEKHEASRAAEYDYPQYPSYDYHPYGYQRPSPYSYGSYGYHEPSRMYMHPTALHYSAQKPDRPKLDPPKKDLSSLMTPTATKLANKVSGIITFVLALLTGSTANNPEITGLKDLVINGIVKPLFIAKGGLKVLLSKLTIPVISLLLINIEVFITIWWLWEDCPESIPPPYPPPKPEYEY